MNTNDRAACGLLSARETADALRVSERNLERWRLAAYQRLCERGRFVQPRSAEALERDVLAASDPFTAMEMECFVRDPAGSVTKSRVGLSG